MVEKQHDLENNPLLQFHGLPRFDKIEPEHVIPAMKQILKEAEEKLAALEKSYEPTWEGLLQPLEEMGIPFEYSWGPINHLLGVKNSPELRKAHEAVLNEVVTFSLRLRQNPAIYRGLKTIKNGKSWDSYSPAQKRVIELKILSADLAGVGLEGEERKRFIEIETESSRLSTDFSNHVLDATKAFALDIHDQPDTEGWPQSLKQIATQSFNISNPGLDNKATPEEGPWRITLDFPVFMPFMQHSRKRDQREIVYHAQVTRASEGKLDNKPLINKLLQLREEKARLLGYQSYADLSLASKMAPDVAAVETMSLELKQAAKPFADQEYQEVVKLAIESGQTEEIKQWDWAFWSERMREKRFDYTDDQLRPYFQMPRVLDGLFSLAQKLFGITIEEEPGDFPRWHPDVKLFYINNEDDERLASFFLDPYSRPQEKRGGAWMDECMNRRVIDGQIHLPVIHLCCNGTPPVGDQPSLMSFREVETLFHEFGHGLQGMLTTINETDVAGINGVEWDAVELPSQFMENWCYHKPTLIGLTAHVETGESLPDELFEKIKASRTFQSGYQTMRQLLFGLVDMKLHHQFDPSGNQSVFDLYFDLAREFSVFSPYEQDRFLCSFSHIFAGGYAAGYYSYKWAEVLSADVFAAFEEAGLDSEETVREIGLKFRNTVLSLGGSVHPMEVFKKFRGREPSTEALLRHCGFVENRP
ncbi:M3 family metallopeptidase [bacterium]|nr:M3 family metallopeptidase [bacterium]